MQIVHLAHPSRLTLWAAALTFALSLCGSGPASEVTAIKVSPRSPLRRDFVKVHRLWANRVLLAPLAEHLRGTPEEKEALSFATQALDDLAYWSITPDRQALSGTGAKVIQSGCREPLVRFLATRLHEHTFGATDETAKIYEEVLAELSQQHAYGAALLCVAGESLRALKERRQENREKTEKQICASLRAAFEDGSYRPGDADVFLEQQFGEDLSGDTWALQSEEVQAIYAQSPMPLWVRLTLRGRYEINLAWRDRGTGWANTVSEKSRAGFGRHCELAHADLTAAWQQHPQSPFAAGELIGLLATGGWSGQNESERLWFDRAVEARFDHWPAYSAMLHFGLPRWGGSHEWMLGFGRACLATKRFDTKVPLAMIEAVRQVMDELPDKRGFLRSRPDLARDLVAADWGLLSDPHTEDGGPNRQSACAVHAWAGGDYTTARAVMSKLPNGLTWGHSFLQDLRASPREMAAEIAMFGTKAWPSYLKGREAFERGDSGHARSNFASALESVTDANATIWLSDQISLVDFEEKFALGDWVKIELRAGSQWLGLGGTWEVSPMGQMMWHGTGGKGLIIFRGRLGAAFEARARVKFYEPETKNHTLALAVGYHEPSGEDWLGCGTYQAPNSRISASIYDTFYPSDAPHLRVKLASENQYYVRVNGGTVHFELNQQLIAARYHPTKGTVDLRDGQIGISILKSAPGDEAHLFDLEVRRLPPEKPFTEDAAVDLLTGHLWKYDTDLYEFHRDWTVVQRGKGWVSSSWQVDRDPSRIVIFFENGKSVTYTLDNGEFFHNSGWRFEKVDLAR